MGQREVIGLRLGHDLRVATAGGRVVVPLSIAVGTLRSAPKLAVDFVVDV